MDAPGGNIREKAKRVDYQPRRGVILLASGFNPGVNNTVINRFGEIFDSEAENHDKTHKEVNQDIIK